MIFTDTQYPSYLKYDTHKIIVYLLSSVNEIFLVLITHLVKQTGLVKPF